MKTTIRKRVLAVVSALSVMIAVAVPASALSFNVGSSVADIGTIVSSSSSTVATGLEYNKTTYTDAKGNGQSLYTMEFNPSATGYFPMMYQAKPSYGCTVEKSIAAAEAEGYEVLGGINGEFGSANVENWGTLDSRMITNGRIIADSEDRNVMCLAFDKDSNFQLVKSQIAYHFYIEGKEVLNAAGGAPVIGSINKRYVGTNWWSPYCYFDYATGGQTYTNENVKGVEVVFEKINGTELIVEGVLQGRVVSVNTDTYGTKMTENQFVLYSQNGKENYAALAGLQVGQEVQIYAEELNKESKEIMKNAVSVTAATYPIVMDGVDNSYNTPNAEDIEWTPAQRTAIGVKEDGTLVFVCVDGRGTSENYNNGITLHDLAKMMLSLGCKHAVNLDGGGSTTMVAGDETKITYGRGVSSSLLICKRNDAVSSSAEKTALLALIDEAKAASFAGAEKTAVNKAIAEATAVCADTNATTADYVREYNDLSLAMGLVANVFPKTYISLNGNDWSTDPSVMTATNPSSGVLELKSLKAGWPWAGLSCNVEASANARLYFDVTVSANASIILYSGATSYNLNQWIAPGSIDSAGANPSYDILGNGKSFKGFIEISDLNAEGLTITALQICSSANSASSVTLRDFSIRTAYSAGDADGDYFVNSNDARAIVYHVAGGKTLSGDALKAADSNGDGYVNTADIRYALEKSVGLV